MRRRGFVQEGFCPGWVLTRRGFVQDGFCPGEVLTRRGFVWLLCIYINSLTTLNHMKLD